MKAGFSLLELRVLESIDSGIPYVSDLPGNVSVAEIRLRLSGRGYASFVGDGLQITELGKTVLAKWRKAFLASCKDFN